MLELAARHAVAAGTILGEGPLWHRDALWFPCIRGQHLHRWHGEHLDVFDAGRPISFAVPTRDDRWIVGLKDGIALWKPGLDEPRIIAAPEAHLPGNRFNDGKADPTGRLYAGTMADPVLPGRGTLYRLDPDLTLTPLIAGVTISNGLAWDTARGLMHYIDTPTHRITTYRWDQATGDITQPRTLFEFDPHLGAPDGMTIDTQGRLYVAMWGGSAVLIVDPQRAGLVGRIAVDAPHVTSCTFGGPDLATLFITTAADELTEAQRSACPRSGDLFAAELPGVRGLPADRFAGP